MYASVFCMQMIVCTSMHLFLLHNQTHPLGLVQEDSCPLFSCSIISKKNGNINNVSLKKSECKNKPLPMMK